MASASTLCLNDFRGMHFGHTELLQERWTPHRIQNMVSPQALAKVQTRSLSERELPAKLGLKVAAPGAKGLTFAGENAYLHGVPLHNLQYHPSSNSVSFGSPSEEAPIGNLFFSADRSAFIGHMAATPSSELTTVRGLNTVTHYKTQRQEDGGPWEDWVELVIGTKWEAEGGNTILKQVVTLGTDDISTRVAVVATSNVWDTTYHMAPSQSDPFNPDLSEFTILIKLQFTEPLSIFDGTYTDQFGQVFKFKGSSYTPAPETTVKDAHMTLLKAPKPAPPIGLRSAALNVQDLLSLSPLQPDGKKIDEEGNETGEDKYKDIAQEKTGEYFQQMLIASLPGESDGRSWLSQLYGPAPILSDGVKKIQQDHLEYLEKEAIPNFGQLLRDNVRDEQHMASIDKIDGEKLAKNYENMGQSNEYGELSQKLYIEGFRDAVRGIRPYLDDASEDWGQKFFDFLTSPNFLNVWAVQVASGQFKNVKETMYQQWVKLSILCPDDANKEPEENRPTQALSIMLATILNAQYSKAKWIEDMLPYLEQAIDELQSGTANFGDQILDQNAEEQQKILNQMLSTYDTQAELAVFVSGLFARDANNPAMATPTQDIADAVENETRFKKLVTGSKSFANKAAAAIKILAFGAVAGYFLHQVIGQNGNNALADIGLTLTATGFLVKGIQDLMATRVGKYLTRTVNVLDGTVGDVMKSFTSWFTKEGVESASWASKVFGKNAAEFLGKRLGPALAVFGIALCAYDLSKAIKTGDVRNIIFESLNLTVAVLSVVFIGLELLSFAWAGPVGLAIAVIGVLIAVVQLLWNIFNPPKPPPDPVEKFIEGPLKGAGFAD